MSDHNKEDKKDPPRIVVSAFTEETSSASANNNENNDFELISAHSSNVSSDESPRSLPRRRQKPSDHHHATNIAFQQNSHVTDSLLSRRSSIGSSISAGVRGSIEYNKRLSFLDDDDKIDGRLSGDEGNSHSQLSDSELKFEDRLFNRWDRFKDKKRNNRLNSRSRSNSSSSSQERSTKPNLKLQIPVNSVGSNNSRGSPSTGSPGLSPNVLQLPNLSNNSKTSLHKVSEEDLNDLDLALNDALKSALGKSKPKWETDAKLKDRLKLHSNQSTSSFQTGHDLELGIPRSSVKEFENDIELSDLPSHEVTHQLHVGSSDNYDAISNSSKKSTKNLNFFSSIVKMAKNINADEDEDFKTLINNDEDDDEDRQNPESGLNSLYSYGVNDLSTVISMNHSIDESPLNPFDDSNEIPNKIPQERFEPLFGKSLGIFPRHSRIRKLSYKVITSSTFQKLISALLISQVCIVSSEQADPISGYIKSKKYTVSDWILFAFYLVYTLDSILKIISFGLFDDSQMFKEMKAESYQTLLERYYHGVSTSIKKGESLLSPRSFVKSIKHHTKVSSILYAIDDDVQKPNVGESLGDDFLDNDKMRTIPSLHRAFLQNDWNRVDLVSVISFWISFILALNSAADIGRCQIFRSLMCLKMLRLLNYSSSSRMVLRGIKNAIIQSKKVIGFLLCFWVILSIIGVESFKSSLRRQCVWTNPNNSTDTYLNAFQFCGSYLDPDTLQLMPYLNSDGTSSGVIKGFACPVNSVCITGENPYNGAVSFDNIFSSMELVFVIMSANTFTDIMYYTMDSDNMAASLFYITSIFVLVIWLLNLIIAVIIQSYRELAEKENKGKRPSIWEQASDLHNEFYQLSAHYVKSFNKSNSIFVLVILFNIAFDATRSINMDEGFSDTYNICDLSVSAVLMVEIILRFISYCLDRNPSMFFYSIFNNIDLALAVIDLVITLPPLYRKMGQIVYGWLSLFIILRFYRVIYWFKSLRKSWAIVFNRVRTLLKMAWFGVFFIYLVSLIMSRLFDGILLASDDQPWTMEDFPNSIISLYIITSTENWSSILYATQEATDSTFNRLCISIYLLGWFFISNTVLLSIFIGVITEGLELSINEKARNQLEKFIADCANNMSQSDDRGLFELVKAKLENDTGNSNVDASELLNHVNSMLMKLDLPPINPDDYRERTLLDRFKESTIVSKISGTLLLIKNKVLLQVLRTIHTIRYKISRKSINTPFPAFNENLASDRINSLNQGDRSLYVFSDYNIIRNTFQKWTSPPIGTRTEGAQPHHLATMIFNGLMFIFSIVVVVFACYVTPLYKYGNNDTFSYDYYVDIVFMAIFTIEFIIKVIADGFIFGPHAYLKSFWNILDFSVLISFWITTMSVLSGSNKLLVTFGALRALRAFRLLTITKVSLWNFEAAIIGGANQILIASVISISLLLPFSLWGLNIFNGRLTTCSDGSALNECALESVVEVANWNVLSPRFEDTPNLNFDTFNSSFRSLFEIISLEGWTQLLENVMSIVPSDKEPELLMAPFNASFVVLFNFTSIILILNLFVSIVIDSYAKKTGTAFLLDSQHSWYEVKKVLKNVKPSKRRNLDNMSPFKRKMNSLMLNKTGIVDKIVSTLFFVHFMVLVTEYYPYPEYGDTIRHAIFIFTTGGLLLHLYLVFYVLGFRVFVSNRWNVVRLILLSSSFIMNIIAFNIQTGSVFINIDKTVSVIILLFVIPRVDISNQLLMFGSASVTPLFWMIYTWLVLYIVFAIAMNQIFGLTRLGPNTGGNLNARTVTKALIMLFRSSFGEGWNDTMTDFEVELPFCSNVDGVSDCGNQTLAQLLFMLWNILSMYVFLNILISVVINNFSYVYHTNGEHKLLTRQELRKFKSAWNEFDNYGTGYIHLDKVSEFINSLDGILSFHIYPKSMRISELTKKWVKPSTTSDPYNVQLNYNVINNHFAICNFKSIRQRRKRYDRMCIEIEQSATEYEDIHGERIQQVSFRNVILAVGFYSRFKNSNCLVISDRIKYNYNLQRVQRLLKVTKNIATIKMVYTTLQWHYLRTKKNILEKLKMATPSEALRIKSLISERLTGTEIDYSTLLEKIKNDIEDDVQILTTGNDLSRVTSNTSSINPFGDVYKKNIYRDEK